MTCNSAPKNTGLGGLFTLGSVEFSAIHYLVRGPETQPALVLGFNGVQFPLFAAHP